MTHTGAVSAPADDTPVTIATFPNPHEAELAHAALESQGIPAVVHNDHGQYASAGAWVQLQVASSYSEWARTLLERGPQDERAEAIAAKEVDAAIPPDDMAPLRVNRRILLARWFLYAGALTFLLYGFLFPLSVVALALALWSKVDPRRAFGVAYCLQAVVVLVSVAISGLAGLTSLIALVAFHFARASAAPMPRPSLVASPYSRLRSIDIGDSWKVGQASAAPAAWPIWFFHDVGWLVFAFVVALGLAAAARA